MRSLKQVQGDGKIRLCHIQEDDFFEKALRDTGDDRPDKIAVGVEDTHALTILDIRKD